MERTTTGGDEFEQLNDMLKEKDHVIEMLSKEKNYYLRKTELLGK